VELLPIVNHSSEGAASIHRFVNISELHETAQEPLEESVVFGQASINPNINPIPADPEGAAAMIRLACCSP
jgi:hypothetical protein